MTHSTTPHTATQCLTAINEALDNGRHSVARSLAAKGASDHPEDKELQKMAQILAPPVTMPRAEFPPQIQNREWAETYTRDVDTCAGIRTRTYEHLARVCHKAGKDALARVIGSQAYREGVLAMDALELAHDLEGMKAHGRAWIAVLTVIAQGEEGHAWSCGK